MSKPEALHAGIDVEHVSDASNRFTTFLNTAPVSFDIDLPLSRQENHLAAADELDNLNLDQEYITVPGQETAYARFGRMVRVRVRPPRGVGKNFGSKAGRKAAIKESLQAQGFGFGAKGFMKDALFTLPAYTLGMGYFFGWTSTAAYTAEIGTALSFLGVEALTVGALMGLALIPGVGGAAYWAVNKLIKGLPGRIAAKVAPVWTKRVTDSIAAGWVFLDKLAYQTAQSGVNDTGWKKHAKGILAIPAFAYMAYRFANTTVSGLLDVAFSLGANSEGWSKMYHGAAGLGNMGLGLFGMGHPEVHFNALIREDENDINPTNIPLRIGNAIIKGTRDKRLDADELDRDGEIGEPDAVRA